MIGALIRAGVCQQGQLAASDISNERLDAVNKDHGVDITGNNDNLYTLSDVIVLAVKPQQMDQVLESLVTAPGRGKEESGKKLVISIAAGVPAARIEKILYNGLDQGQQENLPVIRVMPNTPALVGQGMAGMARGRFAADKDAALARRILEAFGKVIELPERDLDAVTAISGSGPAYAFFLAEAMMAAAGDLGLSKDAARTLTVQTILGAACLMEHQDEPPETLRARVTSPGGTTEAAFNVIEKNDVKQILVRAIRAAWERSGELSK